MTQIKQERTALYRLYDVNKTVVYIGISANPELRWEQHARDKEWWPQVVEKSVEWHDTRTLALTAEAVAIVEEGPIHNRTHNARGQAKEAKKRYAASLQREGAFKVALEAVRGTPEFASMTYAEWHIAAAEAVGYEERATYWRRVKATVDEAPPLTPGQQAQLRVLLRP